MRDCLCVCACVMCAFVCILSIYLLFMCDHVLVYDWLESYVYVHCTMYLRIKGSVMNT